MINTKNLTILICLMVVSFAGLAAFAQGNSKPANNATADQLVNINTATVSQLVSLPGIGPKTAEKIVEYRNKNGKFKTKEEIMNVRGIGEKKFARIKDKIKI